MSLIEQDKSIMDQAVGILYTMPEFSLPIQNSESCETCSHA